PSVSYNRNVQSLNFFYFRVVNLGKNQLVTKAKRVVPASVEGASRKPSKIAHARQRNAGEAVEELIHPVAPQSHHRSDRHVLAQFEIRYRFPRPRDDRLLAGNLAQLLSAGVQQLGVLDGFTQSHVQYDLPQTWDRHAVRVLELLHQGRHDFLLIFLFQTRRHVPFTSSRKSRGPQKQRSALPLLIQRFLALRANAYFLATGHLPVLDACRSAFAAHQGYVGNVDGSFFFQNPAADLLGRIGARVPFNHVNMLDVEAPLAGFDFQNPPHLALIPTGNHLHFVVLLDIQSESHHRTSGASETIFKNFFSRSSRATGPKTRVPTGSLASLMSTAAFSSNRM